MTIAAESADVLADGTRARLESDVNAALKRRPAHEARLAGVMRALAPLSVGLRAQLRVVLDRMVRRSSFERPLYAAVVRALAGDGSPEVGELIARALSCDQGPSLSTLSAACFCRSPLLREPLAKAAISRQAHLAFAAEVARLSRGESNGAAVASIAPKIKESHRIALCLEMFAPLLSAPALPRQIGPALSVLRDAERHLGRWLVLAEIAVRSGDTGPSEQARERARKGPDSARAAWSLVSWALEPNTEFPSVRPTVELVARLSDRPSADRDTTFLFRLAQARVPSARPMLESLAKNGPTGDESAVRAMFHLYRDYGYERYRENLTDVARTPRRDSLRGLAAACLYDAGETAMALSVAESLADSRHLPSLAWSTLIRARHAALFDSTIVVEQTYRRVQLGWVE